MRTKVKVIREDISFYLPRFVLTSILFNGSCVVFRLTAAAFFYASVRGYANVVLGAAFLTNAGLLASIATSKITLVVLFSALSIFVPNGEH